MPVARTATSAVFARDLATTALVLGLAAALWFGWALADPPDSWVAVLDVASFVGVGLAGVAAVQAWRCRGRGSAIDGPDQARAFGRVVVVEVLAIAVGVGVMLAAGGAAYVAAWVLFVVGVHFVPLGRILSIPVLRGVGLALAAVAIVAVALGTASRVTPATLAGAGGGAVMVLGATWAVLVSQVVATRRRP